MARLMLRNVTVFSLFSALVLPGCGKATGPKKHSVRGVVQINGQAAERVAVLFQHVDSSLGGNLRFPTGVTDSEGRFALSTDGDKDGAVEGEYLVTFTWLSSPDLDAYDLLGGSLSDPKKSQHRFRVEPGKEAIASFELTIPKESIGKQRRKR